MKNNLAELERFGARADGWWMTSAADSGRVNASLSRVPSSAGGHIALNDTPPLLSLRTISCTANLLLGALPRPRPTHSPAMTSGAGFGAGFANPEAAFSPAASPPVFLRLSSYT